MPSAHLYIRKKDWEAWKNIPNKAAFVHAALNREVKSGRKPLPAVKLKNRKYEKKKAPEVLQMCEIHGTTVNVCRRFHE